MSIYWGLQYAGLLQGQECRFGASMMDNKGCLNKEQASKQVATRLFVHLFPHDKRLHFYMLYIRELWCNSVTYIAINSLYIMCNQVNFCYE